MDINIKNINKNKNILSRLEVFIFFYCTILAMEIIFSLFINTIPTLESIINIVLHTAIVSSILSIISGLFTKKINKIIISIILFIISLLFTVQIVFHNIFNVYFNFLLIGLSDQINSFLGDALKYILNNSLYIIIFFLPFIIFLLFSKHFELRRNDKINIFIYIFIITLSLLLFIINMNSTKGETGSTYSLYKESSSYEQNINKLGVLNSYELDFIRVIFGSKDDIDNIEIKDEEEVIKEVEIKYDDNKLDLNFDKPTNNKDIQTINKYMKNSDYSSQNEYTGKFKDYNLVYIVAESFSEIGVNEELTPTLYKLIHDGYYFSNFYTPLNLSTIGGEFQGITGLYPNSSILKKWRSGSNYYPYGLGTVFSNMGYNTYAYHDNWYKFQDRHKYLKALGFTNYKACSNGLEKKMNCKRWPSSDVDMIKATTDDYINSDKPFMTYYMTVSGHMGYSNSSNYIANKNKSLVKDLKVSSAAKAYQATQIELDRALNELIVRLESSGKLDNTVIVLVADHYPYGLELSAINELSSYKRDSTYEVNHNNLIIWNKNIEHLEINKPAMSVDLIPTVYNLFGVKYDSRLFAGRDIFSDSEGIVIFNNRSWITKEGKYYSSSNKFYGNNVDSSYINKVNSLVKNRLNISKKIIQNDYYRYLFK